MVKIDEDKKKTMSNAHWACRAVSPSLTIASNFPSSQIIQMFRIQWNISEITLRDILYNATEITLNVITEFDAFE